MHFIGVFNERNSATRDDDDQANVFRSSCISFCITEHAVCRFVNYWKWSSVFHPRKREKAECYRKKTMCLRRAVKENSEYYNFSIYFFMACVCVSTCRIAKCGANTSMRFRRLRENCNKKFINSKLTREKLLPGFLSWLGLMPHFFLFLFVC